MPSYVDTFVNFLHVHEEEEEMVVPKANLPGQRKLGPNPVRLPTGDQGNGSFRTNY